MVSMKDIAQRCGVSVATVSKALNGQQDISEETRARVCAVADELGYMTNAAAKALKTNRTYNLGVLFADRQRSGLTHEYFARILESFKAQAESHGYDITFINQNVGGKPTTYLQHCRYRGVDGVVVVSVDYTDPEVRELVDSKIPLVTIDHVVNDRISVTSDNVNGLDALVRYAYSMGHRRIAYLYGDSCAVTRQRLVGFYRACEALGLNVPPSYVQECSYHNPERCAEATKALLALRERPTCIIFPDDYSFVGGHRVIANARLRVPGDISVMGYDGIHLAKVMGLTTYVQDMESLGRIAATQLINLIERPKTTCIESIQVQGSLQVGWSVRNLNQK
ncbi:MAG: LacI family DNA-binding transcriptional regulator [Eubacteriales bacterium]|nr:LacI family DNA-binding transcriptional regulator [Eubacteriales bacterium]